MGISSCGCGNSDGDKEQCRIDEAFQENLLNIIKLKFEKLEFYVEKIEEADFKGILYSQPNVKEILEKFDKTPDTYPSNENPTEISYNMPPIKMVSKADNVEGYYHGGFNSSGAFCGKGIHLVPEKLIYSGYFSDDEYNGKGLMIKKNGDYLYSDWVEGMCTGKGILVVNGRFEYEGNFINNKKNGYGVEKYPDGSFYEGNFVDNKKSGKGKGTFSNGESYEGEYENNFYNGEGIYKWPEGRIYQGEFKNGNIEGKGKTIFKDGSQYEGYYKGGIKNGKGYYSWPNGKQFHGIWLNNVLHGDGYYIIGDEKFDVTFRFGKIISTKNSSIINTISNSEEKHQKFGISSIDNRQDIENIDQYICPICNNLLYNPYKCISCLKNYCVDCITIKQQNTKKCPNCDGNTYENNLDLLHELMQKIKVNCKSCHNKIDYQASLTHFH